MLANLSPRFDPKAMATMREGIFSSFGGWIAEINWAKRESLALAASGIDENE